MRKSYWMVAAAALAVAACSDSAVGPNDGLTPTPGGTAVFDIITQQFTLPSGVVDSYQGSRMNIPTVGFTAVMDGGAKNDGTAGTEPDRSTPSNVLSFTDGEWFSLGLFVGPATEEGYVIVDFGELVAGKGAVVWEQTFNTAAYPTELADVYASNDPLGPWDLLGQVGNKGTTDSECEAAGSADCTYTVLPETEMCYQYIKVVNAISADGYNALDYVTGGEVNAAPGAAGYPGNELIPDGFDVQAIAFESLCDTGGCTLTQGYWKNHPEDWGATDPNSLFFDTDWTWMEVLQAPPRGGNSYLILAHQYIAAYLSSTVNGATPPAELAQAEALLDGVTGEPFVKDDSWNSLASALDFFVNDNHCSEESEDIL
jgi:hypothetical protein